ncbi:MAG: amino acid racemase [Oscillospiraceae bacterium]|nr:amino acid racemase [Oscillospiraceae bacterium]
MKEKLGIIGGLGPMASAQFLELLTDKTDAATDQEHIEVFLYSRPQTPDRTAFLLGQSQDNPYPVLLDSGRMLESMGCRVLVMPCMTAYSFYPQLKDDFQATLVNPILETAAVLRARGVRKAGIMATDGTLQVGTFQQAFSGCGIEPIVPDRVHQAEVMSIIYDDVKSGRPADMERFHAVAHAMRAQGAECVILGCTELSVIRQTQKIGAGFLDAMEVLAERAIEACGYRVKPEQQVCAAAVAACQ